MSVPPIHDIQLDPVYDRLRTCGQLRVLKYWNSLDDAQRVEFLEQLKRLDLERIIEAQQIARGHHAAAHPLAQATPPAYIPCSDTEARQRAHAEGENILRAGRVAALTVAGGQATRLGLQGPKGAFEVTPIRHKSLFEVFAQKILAAQRRYGASIPWVVMTSPINQEATRRFFQAHGYWGLRQEDVFFMEQGQVPSTDYAGEFLLEAPNKLSLNPDGHGGVFRALHSSGLTKVLKDRGIELLSYFQVDNPLIQVIDPVFIGLHTQHGSEFSSKIVLKRSPHEKVGLFIESKGALHVVEYSDMPEEFKALTDADGSLRWRSANIAVHMLSLDFCVHMAEQTLPYHQAIKKIKALDEQGRLAELQGIKYEQFIFDALPFAKNPLLVETHREWEFSPVKNAAGPDSAETCRAAQIALWASWFEAAAALVERDSHGHPVGDVEISPLFADSLESFVERVRSSKLKLEWRAGLYLE